MKYNTYFVATIMVLASLSTEKSGKAQTAIQSDSVVDSVGVNIHLHHNNTLYYDNFPLVLAQLKALGVRHVRDGLIDTTWTGYYDHHNQLGAAGIKGSFTTSVGQSDTLLRSYPSRVAASFEQYESPNEYDVNGGPNWSMNLYSFIPMMYTAIKSYPATASLPVVGPSLVEQSSYPVMSGVGSSIDYANLHNYYGGNAPGTPGWGDNGYGSINWNLKNANGAWPGKKLITTETGYIDDVTEVNGISQSAIATYMPRVVLEQILHGIKRTYIYELADSAKPLSGLLTSTGTPKASFKSLQGLLNLLKDPGAAFAPTSLAYTLSGQTANVDKLLVQRRDGTFLLLLWVEKQCFDVNAKQPIAIPAQAVTLKLPQNVKRVLPHQFGSDGSVKNGTATVTSTVNLSLTDKVLALEITLTNAAKPKLL